MYVMYKTIKINISKWPLVLSRVRLICPTHVVSSYKSKPK